MQRSILLACLACAFALTGCGSNSNGTVAVMDTSMGTVKIELFDEESPITVKNFLKYVDEKHYDSTIFHRVIDGFMIQGGGFDKDFKQLNTPGTPGIKNEAGNGKLNLRGTLAMARTPDPNSATDQFFISVKDNSDLDRKPGKGNEGYAVFGKVIEGMDVVDKIARVKTTTKDTVQGPFKDVPVENVIIKSIRREKS